MDARSAAIDSAWWSPFEALDQMRRWHGVVLDALGCGPVESPWRVVLQEPIMTLRAYTEERTSGPAVLIIPAPIKRAYIWDLLPGASVVQKCVRGGFRVYLMHWEEPGPQEQQSGLDVYADKLILKCLHAINQDERAGPVTLAGHSLGGTFAAIFAGLHPEMPINLILLGAPLYFGAGTDVLSPWVAVSPPAPILSAYLGSISGSFLSTVSLLSSPEAFVISRWRDWLSSLGDPQALETHLKVDRWTQDELPLPRRLFEEIMEWLYRENRFARGALTIAGHRTTPDRIRAPLLMVVEKQSAVASPQSVLPFYHTVRSIAKRVLWYDGDKGVALQHVGMLVGKTAHEILWPAIVQWAAQHAT